MDYTHLYSTRIQKTFDEDNEDIFAILATAYAKNPKLELQLINYYKGLTISFKARIACIEKGSLDIDLNAQQAIAIDDEHYTFIRSKLFKHDVLAKAQYVNIKRNAASFRQLTYVEIMAERRNNLRVKLEPPINALFMAAAGTARGRLIDISVAGTLMQSDQPQEVELGEESKLLFMIQDVEHNTSFNMKVPAKLVGISDDEKPVYYRFMFTPDKVSEKQISKYLFNRQLDVIRELKDHIEPA